MIRHRLQRNTKHIVLMYFLEIKIICNISVNTTILIMLQQLEDDRRARDQVDRVFKKLDLNQDGVITIEEFIESCLKVGK